MEVGKEFWFVRMVGATLKSRWLFETEWEAGGLIVLKVLGVLLRRGFVDTQVCWKWERGGGEMMVEGSIHMVRKGVCCFVVRNDLMGLVTRL